MTDRGDERFKELHEVFERLEKVAQDHWIALFGAVLSLHTSNRPEEESDSSTATPGSVESPNPEEKILEQGKKGKERASSPSPRDDTAMDDEQRKLVSAPLLARAWEELDIYSSQINTLCERGKIVLKSLFHLAAYVSMKDGLLNVDTEGPHYAVQLVRALGGAERTKELVEMVNFRLVDIAPSHDTAGRDVLEIFEQAKGVGSS